MAKKEFNLYYGDEGSGPISWSGLIHEWKEKGVKVTIKNRERDYEEGQLKQFATVVVTGTQQQIHLFEDGEYTISRG